MHIYEDVAWGVVLLATGSSATISRQFFAQEFWNKANGTERTPILCGLLRV
jgi:hypothetical protein